MKNKFMVAVVLSCAFLFGCDEDVQQTAVPVYQQEPNPAPVVVNNPAPVVVQNHDSGMGSFIAGALVGHALSGGSNTRERVVEHHYYDNRPTSTNNYRSNGSSSSQTKYSAPSSRIQTMKTQPTKRSTYTPFSRSSSSKYSSRKR